MFRVRLRLPLLWCCLDLALLFAAAGGMLPAWVLPPVLLAAHGTLLLAALRGLRRREGDLPGYFLDPRLRRVLTVSSWIVILPPILALLAFVWTGDGLELAIVTALITTILIGAADTFYQSLVDVVEDWAVTVAAATFRKAGQIVSRGDQ